jgi:hypothetical protein
MSLECMRGLLELRYWIQMMKITKFPLRLRVPGFELAQAPPNESVFFKNENAVADAFLGL